MKRVIVLAALVAAAAIAAFDSSQILKAQGNQHAYFDAMVRRGDHWKSYSLRDANQLTYRDQGGLTDSNDRVTGLWVTYNPPADTDPHRQDAAKIVIPPFRQWLTILNGISATDSFIALPQPFSLSPFVVGRSLKIDNEIMTVSNDGNSSGIFVRRGQGGTAAAPHAAGAQLKLSTNSLQAQVKLPLDTQDGNRYLFTWDTYWTDSYVRSGLSGHKTFQFSSGGNSGTIWLEPQTDFSNSWGRASCFDPNRHVSSFSTRSYNQSPAGSSDWAQTDGNRIGPGTQSNEPLSPQIGTFCIKANTWTRFWFTINQVSNNYDTVSAWVADEVTEPVRIFNELKISVRTTGAFANTINKFWLEYDTSTTDHVRLDQRNFVSYFRNFVALRNPPGDITSLLLKPLPGLEPVAGPAAPSNVRIQRSS